MIAGLPYDAEVEYLEGTGTQWIDTGIFPTDTTGIKLTILQKTTDERVAAGCMVTVPISNRFVVPYSNNGALNIFFGWGGNNPIFNQQFPISSKIQVSLNFYNSRVAALENYTSALVGTLSPIGKTLLLFARKVGDNANVPFVGNIYQAQISDGTSTLVRDFIPVRVGQVGYMYDRVSRKLFGNAGTGAFVLGPDVATPVMGLRRYAESSMLPPGARWVEYLESTGTQWIDTGIVPEIGDSVRMVFQLTRHSTEYDQIMGAGALTYQFCFPTRSENTTSGVIYCRAWQGGSGYAAPPLSSNSIVPNHTIDFNIKHLSGNNYRFSVGLDYIDLVAMSEIDGPIEYRNLLIFRRPNVGNSRIKCYAFQLWDSNNILVRDFRPIAIGTTGYMLDLVSGEYLPYGNKGTGDFVIGPDISAPTI